MHAIRSQARRLAWQSDDESKNLNPFARNAPRGPRNPDIEQGIDRRRTFPRTSMEENPNRGNDPTPLDRQVSVPGTAAERRSRGNGIGKSNLSSPNEEYGNGAKDSAEKSDVQEGLQNTNSHFTNASDGIPPETLAAPRRRKRDMFKFGKGKHEEDDDSLTRTQSQTDLREKRKRWKSNITVKSMFRHTVLGSWVNVLLVAVPVGFAVNYSHVNGVATFVVNFIAIIPLAAMLSFATEELALYVGETLGGLLNATFGNATELIVSVIALAQNKILIVQTSLIGSMLSNLLLVLGMCFFFGGLRRVNQYFNVTVAQTASSLLALSIGSLIIPTAFQLFGKNTNVDTTNRGVAPISRGTSVILLVVYASYLLFQLRTHADMYNKPSQKVAKKPKKTGFPYGKKDTSESQDISPVSAGKSAPANGSVEEKENNTNPQSELSDVSDPEDEGETPSLTVVGALVTLTISTVLIAFCSEFMVTGIDAISGSVSEEFIGLILLPIVGNAAEHATAVTVACKDKMDLAIGVAVGSSMQIALLVLPLMVVISWIGLGHDAMTLDFDGFQVTVLFIAVLLVNYLIQDGESHWLEGVLLQTLYLIIAVSAWFYPTNGDVAG